MPYEFDPGRPIYLQLAERMIQAVGSGEYEPGQRLPGVRELAARYGVNPNTVQRTMAELERTGLVYSERTAGRFVTGDQECIRRIRRAEALKQASVFLEQMKKMGFHENEISELLSEAAQMRKEPVND